MSKERWTLDDLSERVEAALAVVDYVPAESARVRAVPDRRTIRYYTTLGLLDRPAALRGRTALYARRHLLQLVAIKRLQAEGASLAQVQERLAGLDDASLEGLARLPEVLPAPAPTAAEAEAEAVEEHAFWEALPPPAPQAPRQALEEPTHEHKAEVLSRVRQARPELPSPDAWTGLTLAEETILLLPGARALSADDAAALRQAAEPLLRMLRARGIA
ncbi:MAG: MerR family transcriptional regulator [Planctomycetes bacterium]|nr:MerR family transcriptional regulator [Planctomycetota bacterium]